MTAANNAKGSTCSPLNFESTIPRGMAERGCFGPKDAFDAIQNWRKFASSSKGYVGWVPNYLLSDQHQVATILGCTTPLLLRRCGSCFKVIGEAFLIGLMAGEAIEMVEDERAEIVEIELM